LKAWPKRIFFVYIAATLPVLAYLFGLMLVTAPALFTAGRDAFAAQLAHVQSNESLRLSALAVTQMLLIAIPAIGTVLIMLIVRSLPLIPFSARLSPSTRRLAGQLAFASASVMVVVWLSLGTAPTATSAPVASETESVVARARQTLAAVETLQAEFEGVIGPDTFHGTLALKRPNFAKIEVRGSEGLGTFRVVSDGNEVLTYFPADKQFTKVRPGQKGQYVSAFIVDHVHHFFRPDGVAHVPAGGAATLATDSSVNSADYRVLDVSAATGNRTTRYFISEHDGLIHRIAYRRAGDDTAAIGYSSRKSA
jgi:outer membrane lipoprotein-sorting protein